MLRGIDQAFKSQGINPGTSADLTVATVLAASLEDFYTD
jgi:triphosphoribosyl-dephospho-CoA synthase